MIFLLLILPLVSGLHCSSGVAAEAQGDTSFPIKDSSAQLSDWQRISSTALGYDLQYKVYLPENYAQLESLPVAYITDGAWFLEEHINDTLTHAITTGKIPSVIAVFLDARAPDKLSKNRRNQQFICNPQFVEFFDQELIPHIDKTYSTSPKREDRALFGMSFGGLFALYYGGQSQERIGNLSIMSAATHPCPEVFEPWEQEAPLPFNVFLSVGTEGDTDYASYRLQPTIEKKGYTYSFTELPYGHTRAVWRPLVDDALVQFFGEGRN